MDVLLNKGELDSSGVHSYLAYIIIIAQLGQKYTWPSVMKYDDMYRKCQALDKFPWGEDISHA